MHPHAVTDHNPNEHYGVRACSFAGQQKCNDCGGRWFSVPTQHVRIANNLAPHVCVCANHLAVALKAVNPPKARKTKSRPGEPVPDLMAALEASLSGLTSHEDLSL